MDLALIVLVAALFCVCSLWFQDLKRIDRERAAREQAEAELDWASTRYNTLQQFGSMAVRTLRPGPPAPNADKELVRVLIDGKQHAFTDEALQTARGRDIHLFDS